MGAQPQEGELEGAPEWITTFVDMISLLVTFFILLFTFSSMDAFDSFKVPQNLIGTRGTIEDTHGHSAVDPPPDDVMSDFDAQRGATVPHTRPPEELAENLEEMGQKLTEEHVEFDPKDVADGLTIQFDERASFRPGSAKVEPFLAKSLAEFAKVMEHYRHRIVIEGFTDSEFKPSPTYPTPEALSVARATAAARVMLAESNLTPKLLQVAGYGAKRPRNANELPSERTLNRRVEIRIVALDSDQAAALAAVQAGGER